MKTGTSCTLSGGRGCNISECVRDIRGLKGNSASLTDIWIARLKDNILYDGCKIDCKFDGVMKIYVQDSSSIDSASLDYEYAVYETIIKRIVEKGESFNFVRFIGGAKGCSFDSLRDVLRHVQRPTKTLISSPRCSPRRRPLSIKKKGCKKNMKKAGAPPPSTTTDVVSDVSDADPSTRYDATAAMYRTASFITYPGVFGRFKTRPNVTSRIRMSDVTKRLDKATRRNLRNATRYSFFMTTFIPPSSRRIGDFIERDTATSLAVDTASSIVQTLTACCAMSFNGLVHNDLHTGNIWVSKIPKMEMVLKIPQDGSTITIKSTNVFATIFDFDRSYSIDLGDNPMLDDVQCKRSSQCNRFIPNLDSMKFLGYVYARANRTFRSIILDAVSKTPEGRSKIKKVWASNYHLIDPDTKAEMTERFFFNNFHSVDQIVKRFTADLGPAFASIKKNSSI